MKKKMRKPRRAGARVQIFKPVVETKRPQTLPHNMSDESALTLPMEAMPDNLPRIEAQVPLSPVSKESEEEENLGYIQVQRPGEFDPELFSTLSQEESSYYFDVAAQRGRALSVNDQNTRRKHSKPVVASIDVLRSYSLIDDTSTTASSSIVNDGRSGSALRRPSTTSQKPPYRQEYNQYPHEHGSTQRRPVPNLVAQTMQQQHRHALRQQHRHHLLHPVQEDVMETQVPFHSHETSLNQHIQYNDDVNHWREYATMHTTGRGRRATAPLQQHSSSYQSRRHPHPGCDDDTSSLESFFPRVKRIEDDDKSWGIHVLSSVSSVGDRAPPPLQLGTTVPRQTKETEWSDVLSSRTDKRVLVSPRQSLNETHVPPVVPLIPAPMEIDAHSQATSVSMRRSQQKLSKKWKARRRELLLQNKWKEEEDWCRENQNQDWPLAIPEGGEQKPKDIAGRSSSFFLGFFSCT